MKKIQSNIDRDKNVDEKLKNDGWTVIRIWEHEIRKEPEKALRKIITQL
jgi:DNA mismatch endonuclease (patch repair protein)